MKARGLVAVAFALAGGLGASIFFVNRSAHSADHLDSPATRADSTIDINDVYSYMDGNNFVAIMTLYPAAPTTALFSDTAQYVIHTSSGAAYGSITKDYDIICTFAGTTAPQTASCWAGTTDYVTGNAGAATGITSADSKFKVFAGLRADPFFFNLDGFNQTVADVEAAAGSLVFNDAGCPAVNTATSNVLVGQLSHAPDGGAPTDFFGPLNALAIVVQIDKTLVTTGGATVAVWGSTHK